MLKKILFRVSGLLLITAYALPACAFDMSQLMDLLGQRKQGRAQFEETKHIAVLDQPLHASGELYFQAPATLEKRTLKPKAELLSLNGDVITLERDGKKKRFNLSRYPQAAAFVSAIRGLPTGNRQEIEQNYTTRLEGSAARWTLTLTPIQQKVAAIIRTVNVTGETGEVKTIEYVQADGDRSLMTIAPLAEK